MKKALKFWLERSRTHVPVNRDYESFQKSLNRSAASSVYRTVCEDLELESIYDFQNDALTLVSLHPLSWSALHRNGLNSDRTLIPAGGSCFFNVGQFVRQTSRENAVRVRMLRSK